MTDAESLKIKKDFAWNMGLYVSALAMLFVEWHLAVTLLRDLKPTLKDVLQVMTAATIIPGFLLMTAWNRITQETIGLILGAIIGFALGKFA